MAAAALLAAPFLSPSAAIQGQTDDYRVLVVDFLATDAQDRGFGERAANELRKLLEDLPGYDIIERGDVQTELRKYQLKMEELDCSKVRQLGSPQLMSARIAFCVNYGSEGESRKVANVEVWDLWDNQSFTIPGFTVARNAQQQAAQNIFDGFSNFIKQLQYTTYCGQYAQSESWDDALKNCDLALEMNPNAVSTVFLKAGILQKMGPSRYAESLVAAEKVVELDPVNEEALQLAGWLSTQLNQTDKGRQFYRRYLELNPGDAAIRRTIAFDIYEAGDPEGAMQFIEEGLGGATEDVDLLISYGTYAFQAASKRAADIKLENSAGVPSDVADLYRKASSAFEKAFEAKGAELDIGYLRNTVTAHLQLQEYPQAIQLAERFLAAHSNDAELMSRLATAQEKAGQVDAALATLKKIEAVDPNFQNLYARQGLLLLGANRVDEAIPVLRDAVSKGFNADQAARLLLQDANTKAMQTGKENWPYAIRMLEAAKGFPGVSPEQMQEFDFFLGYSVFQSAVALQPANDAVPSVAIARQSLPLFQRAKQHVEASRPWAQRNNRVNNVNQISAAADQYIEMMDAIIKRGD
jgi:tetratricopeptide (TPR) repeat protein